MNDRKIERTIEDYISKTRRVLPEGFETEDLLDELRTHIQEAMKDKLSQRPTQDHLLILEEVLHELGRPEEIADEFKQSRELQQLKENERTPSSRIIGRVILTIIVVTLAAYMVSTMTSGLVDFALAVAVLLLFAVLEGFIRSWQVGKTAK